MIEWLGPIASALPIVLAIALVIWMAIVYHGDSRWLRRQEAVDKDGDMKWPSKDTVTAINALVLGQTDKLAEHENRVARLEELEEREEIVLAEIRSQLTVLADTMGDVKICVIRLEERSKNRRVSDIDSHDLR